MSRRNKVESVEEFLARGGAIKKLDAAPRELQLDIIRKTVVGEPAILLSLEEADLFYGDMSKQSKPKKIKQDVKIDLNALPEALRVKFITKLKEESGGEESEG
jgi:hypothetical protein